MSSLVAPSRRSRCCLTIGQRQRDSSFGPRPSVSVFAGRTTGEQCDCPSVRTRRRWKTLTSWTPSHTDSSEPPPPPGGSRSDLLTMRRQHDASPGQFDHVECVQDERATPSKTASSFLSSESHRCLMPRRCHQRKIAGTGLLAPARRPKPATLSRWRGRPAPRRLLPTGPISDFDVRAFTVKTRAERRPASWNG
jgi:hypothetical protein